MKTPTINSRIVKLEVLKGTATRTSVNAVESRTTSLEGDVATLTQGIASAVSTHNTAPDAHADIRTVIAGKQDSLTISDVGTALLNLSTPTAEKIPRINADASVTLIDVPSNVEEVDADFVSISYNPSGDGGGGMVWSSLTSSSTLEAANGYISSPDIMHVLPAAVSGASVRVYTTSGWCLLLPVSGDVIRAGGTTLLSGSGLGCVVSSAELVCVADGYWDAISTSSVSLGHSALPIVPMWCMYRAEDYDASTGVWIDRGVDPRHLSIYGGTAPAKNIGPVFAGSGTVLCAAGKSGTSDCSMLVVLSSTSTKSQGVIARAFANNGNNLPSALIGYPSAGAWTAMAGNGSPTAWHASMAGGSITSALKSTFVSFAAGQWDQYFYLNGAAVSWSTSLGGAQNNVPVALPMYVGGDPGGDNGPMRGEITDIYVWPVKLTASQRTQALEYVRALRGLY